MSGQPLAALASGVLSAAHCGGATGRGVRVAVIDSGVHAGHPHVGAVEGGVSFAADGARGVDAVDRLGHGTAVAAAIREKAPEAVLIPVKVFDRELRATADALVAAIDWAVAAQVQVINLSLGTANAAHEARLLTALERAAAAGVCLVAAGEQDGTRWLPGSLAPAVGVMLDWTCPRDQADARVEEQGGVRRVTFRASGYPRPIPGVPPERNLKGVSFAVANVTGLLCLHLSRGPVAVTSIPSEP
ncbi:MAG: S8 family serine peptidase [Acidobacteriota bacterium]